MSFYLSPSLLAIDFGNIQAPLQLIEKIGVPYIHIDVMDGCFVPNISFGMPVIQSLRKFSNMVFDVHLMIIEPERYIDEFCDAGADIITFHVESTKVPLEVIEKIKSREKKVGITLKPNTPIEDIKPFLSMVDMILVMSVEPGFGGQSFMEEQLEKVRTLKQLKTDENLTYDIEIDGGITKDNVRQVLDAGANVIVAGSAIFAHPNVAVASVEFMEIFREYE